MSYRVEPTCSPRADVGISDNFVKIGMHRLSANSKKILPCKGAAIRRFNKLSPAWFCRQKRNGKRLAKGPCN